MGTRTLAWVLVLLAVGCDKSAASKTAPSAEPVATASAAPAVDTPQGCQASGTDPVELGTVLGDVFGFAQDGTTLYYTSWQAYGGRGDVGTIRKDGKRGHTLASLALEPQSLVVDDKNIYYTAGIRLMSEPLAGGSPSTLVEVFSSRSIALAGDEIYGVPGDYGPYDRLAKVKKTGGDVDEVATGTRPDKAASPNGYSRVIADSSAIYVTDSGGDRVLAFPLPKGKHKVLVSHQKRAWDLAMAGDNLYFDLAGDGDLLSVPKTGGKPKKLASGLVKNAHIAADARAVYATFSGPKDDDPQKLSEVSTADGSVKPIATIPGLQSVAAIAVDPTCVYWVVTVDATKSIVYARKR